jgi:hypothetical protein
MHTWYLATAALLGLTMAQALAQMPDDDVLTGALPLANEAGNSGSAYAQSGIAPTDLGANARHGDLLMARNTPSFARAAQPMRAPDRIAAPSEGRPHRTGL